MIKNLKVKHLIKSGQLSNDINYRRNFRSSFGHGFYFLEMYKNRVYFFAKFFNCELPFCNHVVTRDTSLTHIEDNIRMFYNVEFY